MTNREWLATLTDEQLEFYIFRVLPKQLNGVAQSYGFLRHWFNMSHKEDFWHEMVIDMEEK